MLTLKVEAGAGEDIRDIIEEMCLLAARTGCIIRADLNGVGTMIKPGADPREAYAGWESELEGKRPYKITCAQPVTIPRDKPWDKPSLQLGKTCDAK